MKGALGILGGMGPMATAAFYRELVIATQASAGQDHVEVVIESDPAIPDRTAFLLGQGPDPFPALLSTAERLASAGAELLVMPCNTAQVFVERLETAVGLPFVRWTDSALDEVARVNRPPIVILATRGTLQADIYGRLLAARGMAYLLPSDEEIETVKALYRELGPEVPLRIDPNSAWTVDTSVRVGRELAEELGRGGYLEDPTASIDGMAEVRRRLLTEGIETPLASNVAVTCFGDIPESVSKDAFQIILCDHHYWGGMRQVQMLANLCKTFGMGMSMHSNNHLGISLMGMAHVAAATPHLTYACDTHYPWQTEEDEVVLGGRVPIVDGCVEIPDRPGLGVELDYDQLARGKERYDKCPYRKRDDAAEMRKRVDPAWERKLPRW